MKLLKSKRTLFPLIVLLSSYCCFVFLFGKYTKQIAQKSLEEHSQVLSDHLWNLNTTAAGEYIKLAAQSNNYLAVQVLDSNGTVFLQTPQREQTLTEKIGLSLKLVQQGQLLTKVTYKNETIGIIKVHWISQTLAIFSFSFIVIVLIYIVILLYLKILDEKRQLEQRVIDRTSQLEEEKRRTEQNSAEVKALLNNSPVGILCVDFNRIIQRVNSEVTRITGYSESELVGNSTAMLYGSKEIFDQHGRANYPKLLKNGYYHANSEIIKKDGSTVMLYWRAQVIKSSDNKLQGVVWNLEDISNRLEMEENLQQMKSLESIGILAGGIAHDFNNLLTAILGNISLAEKFTEPDSKVANLLQTAQKASLRAKDLTNKLLTFSSGGTPVKELASLPELIKDSASFVLSGSNVKCDFHLPEDLWPIKMDKTQINQVIQNLVVNADQAMEDGGTITISCENIDLSKQNIHITGLNKTYYVCIKVKDTGVGITKEHVGRIYDPFYSTKEKGADKGSGLGLSIVHSVIIKHGGTIQVNSTPEQGTEFTIYLPASLQEIDKTVEINTITKGEGVILIMDDEEIIRNVLSEILTHLGYTPVSVSDGQEAIDLYKERLQTNEKFDAVIMDLTVPGGIGGEIAIQKLYELDPTVKGIVSSGYSQKATAYDFEKYGFCNIIPKPYQIHEVSNILSKTLKQ